MARAGIRLRLDRSGRLGLLLMLLFGAAFAALGVHAGVTESLQALGEGGDRGELWVSVLGGALFVAFGGAVIALALLARRNAGTGAAGEDGQPEEPWRLRKEWAERRIPARSGTAAAVLAIFGGVWCAISAPLAWRIPEEAARREEPLVWLMALFPAVGVGLLVWALRAFLRWRKFGASVLELKTLPGVVGGRLLATLQLATQLDAPEGVQLALECIHKRTTGAGRSRSTHESLLWKREHGVAPERLGLGPGGTAVPVEFTIPHACQETHGTGTDDEVLWRVVARAEVAGIDYYARFEVPVFRTEESSEAVTGDEDVPDVVVTSLAGGDALPGSKVRVRPWGAGGREFWFGPARNPVAATVTTLAALGIGGLTLALTQRAPWPVWLGSGCVTALTALGAVVHWVGATRVRVASGAIRVTRGPFGMGRTRTWRAEELSRIAVRRGSQYGSNLYWNIVLEIDRPGRTRPDGSPRSTAHAAGSRLPTQDEARALARAMAETLGIDSE